MQNSGIILLNKPVKISSNSAVNRVKYLIGAKKAGHLGTLDPLASGVLPITFGKATRLFDYFLTKEKVYKSVFVFGFETDTLDCEGKIQKFCDSDINSENISQIINNFIGEIEQIPPQYSALKVNGQKAYDIARKGEKIDLKSRKVIVKNIVFRKIKENQSIELFNFFKDTNQDEISEVVLAKIKGYFLKNAFEFEISCGAGTYIRSLARDIASALKTCGTMVSLMRTKCGKFDISNCISFDQIQNRNFQILTCDEVIDLEKIYISSGECKKLLCGQPVKAENFEGLKKLYSDGEFLGLASNKFGQIKLEIYLKED